MIGVSEIYVRAQVMYSQEKVKTRSESEDRPRQVGSCKFMTLNSIYDAVKRATVAIVAVHERRLPQRPFDIVGSGFCIHADGVIVTCKHVFEAFVPARGTGPVHVRAIPQAMFYGGVQGTQIHMHAVSIVGAGTENGFDLAALKLSRHPAFSEGYPTLPVAEYSELHEMMDVGTCGFPLGSVLQEQLGTVTSSFTKGMISSIIPAQGINREHLRGFQLDLTATNGNSGGPVFCLSTGQVFGVLQGGAQHPETGHVVQGLAKAEPIYPLLESGLIDKLLRPLPPLGSQRCTG